MRNPISNAVKPINRRDLRSCNRCGCPDLAWVQFKSGKWSLVQTAAQRPFWRGDGPAPEGLYALKFNYHRCEDYLNAKAEAERAVALADDVLGGKSASEYLVRVVGHIAGNALREGVNLAEPHSPVQDALRLIAEAAGKVGR